MAPNAVTI
jgi:hypothetical protein